MVQAPMSQRLQLLQVWPGVEPRHQHIPNTITTTNATDAKTKLMLLLVGKDLRCKNSTSRIHPHVWFVASGIDLEFDFPSIRKGISRIQFVRSKRFSFSKSCDLTEHGDACNYAFCFEVVSVLHAARQRGPIHAGSFRFSRSRTLPHHFS